MRSDLYSRISVGSRRLGLLLLACNLFVCSIPRCDFLRAAVQDGLAFIQGDHGTGTAVEHCHSEPMVDQKSQGHATLGLATLCGCELLRFVSTLPPEPIRSVSLRHDSPLTWELVSIPIDNRSTFIPAIEPPYPKA